jgi:ferritin-like metal-binding protein YciE
MSLEPLAETKGQIKTLEKVFKTIGVKPAGEKCDATDGLLKEAVGILAEAQGVALEA